MNQMLNAAFSFLLDVKLTENAFKPKATALPPAPTSDDENGAAQLLQTREEIDNAATTKFASVLAVLARQAHLIGNGVSSEYLQAHLIENGVPNEYLQVGSPFFSPSFFFSFFSFSSLPSVVITLHPLPCVEQGMGNMCGAAVGGNVLSC